MDLENKSVKTTKYGFNKGLRYTTDKDVFRWVDKPFHDYVVKVSNSKDYIAKWDPKQGKYVFFAWGDENALILYQQQIIINKLFS